MDGSGSGSGSDSMLSSKKRNLDGQKNGEGQDRLSSLPASVLHHILSLLPTKYAVGTSILSTKWEYLWTSVPKLDFCDSLLYSTNKNTKKDPRLATTFKNFVNRVLLLHDGLSIDNFTLSCTATYDHIDVNMWITTLLRRKVQQLILSIPVNRAFEIPRCLFRCESLTVLKIDLEYVCYFRVPTSTSFPNLKVLHLARVTFCAAEHSIQQVFFSFPVLEDFYAVIYEMKINIVNISAPLLTKLTLDDDATDFIQEYEIGIYAESLRFLELKSDFKYSLYNLLSLDNAILDVYCSTTKLLGSICNVKDLNLFNRTFDSLFSTEDTLAHLPTFSSLVNLTITAESDDIIIDASNLMSLLHKMPCIEYLSLCVLYTFDNCDDVIPQCIVSNLKFVELNDFFGSESELLLVKVFLTNARLLEKITIGSSVELSTDSNKQLEVTKQLLMMIPRASAHCVIDFA